MLLPTDPLTADPLTQFFMKKFLSLKVSVVMILAIACWLSADCQKSELYPPFTKWYQDPMGLKPLRLSTAVGVAWASAAITASLVLTKKDSLFQKRITLYNENGYSFGYKFPYTTVLNTEFGLMYSVRKWMVIGLGCDLLHFNDKINHTSAIGIMPFSRWYPFVIQKTKLFFQYGGGMSYCFERFPLTGTGWAADTARVGTKFNLMSKYGLGIEFQINKRLSLETSVRHFHLSNGNIKGIQRNPSHDSNGIFAGIVYKLGT